MKNQLLELNICSFVTCGYEPAISAFDLFLFTLGSLLIVSILLLYYNKIPKNTTASNTLDNPVYQSTDILLQSNYNEASFVIAKKPTSIFVKFLVYILILYVVITPFNQFLKLDSLF
jgi:hypothetical protein